MERDRNKSFLSGCRVTNLLLRSPAMRHLLIAICLATTALFPGCATVENPVTGKAERTVMDERSEIAEGQKAHPQILATFGEYEDPKLQAYVNEVGQRLANPTPTIPATYHPG
jgi:predicted Zn-dependent protease